MTADGGRAMRYDVDLAHVDGVAGREPIVCGHRHRHDGVGRCNDGLENRLLVWRRGTQHGMQDDDGGHRERTQQVQDLVAVGPP